MKQRYYFGAMVLMTIGAVAWWMFTAQRAKSQNEARTENVLAVMKGISLAQQSSYEQVWVPASQAGPAHSAVGNFKLHTFSAKLAQLDRSQCPADFVAAYEQWLAAVQAADAYSASNGVADSPVLFHGNGDARSLAIVEQLKQTQSNLRDCAQRYGVIVKRQ
jgi:hypothetical protein